MTHRESASHDHRASPSGGHPLSHHHRNARKVVIVDDDVQVVTMLERFLAERHFDVVTFVRPIEALRFLAHCRADAILADVRMPGMSGIEFLREARMSRSAARVVLMSGYPTLGSVREGIEHGADDFLSKPLSLHQVEKALLGTRVFAGAVLEDVAGTACPSPESSHGLEGSTGSPEIDAAVAVADDLLASLEITKEDNHAAAS